MHPNINNKHVKLPKSLPYIGVSVLIILSTLCYSSELFDPSNVIRYTFQLLSLIILFACSIGLKNHIPFNFGIVSFLVFVILQGLSILWATNIGEALFDFSKWIIIIGIIILTYNGLKKHQIHTICLLSNTAIAVFGISLVATIPQIMQMEDFSWNSRYEITSYFIHKGTYSMQLFLFLPFLLLRTQIPIKGKWIYWFISILVIVLIFFIQARAVLLAFFMSLLTFLTTALLKRANRHHPHRTILTSIVFAFVFGFFIIGCSRMISENSVFGIDTPSSVFSTASMWERQGIWRITFRLIDNQPFTGCGIGNWKIDYPRESVKDVFSMDIMDESFIRPHNEFLRILAESGYLALAVFLIALSYLLIVLLFNKNHSKHEKIKSNLSLSFIVGIIVFAVFDFPFDRLELVLWCSILWGLAIFSSNGKDRRLSKKKAMALAATYLLLFGMGVVRWHSEWNFGKVVYYLPQNRWDKVEDYSKKARTFLCNISPNNDPYAYYTGMARDYQGLSSLKEYRLAVHDSPFHKQSLTDLGRVEYLEGNDTAASIKHLKEAILISPNFSTAYFTLAEVFRREGRKTEALETLCALDLDKKQQIIDKEKNCFLSPEKAKIFSDFVVAEEKATKQELITRVLSDCSSEYEL